MLKHSFSIVLVCFTLLCSGALVSNVFCGSAMRGNAQNVPGLGWAVHLRDAALVREVLAKGVPEDERKPGILINAAQAGDFDIVFLLLAAGFDVNASSDEGFTPLMAAASGAGDKCLMQLLLAAGADVHAASGFGFTALHFAAARDSIECVDLLLHAGSNPNTQTGLAGLPLGMAMSVPVAQTLVAAGADPNKGEGAVHGAVLHGRDNDYAVLKWLLELGADPNLKDRRGRTPLDIARALEVEAAISILLEYGAVPSEM
jgi:ankyrin repeat protein